MWTRRCSAFFACGLCFLAAGCSSRSVPDGSADGVVRLWLEKMEASTDDARVATEAYGLLGPAARENLEERARRVSMLTGKRIAAAEMMAPGRFGLSFRPKRMKVAPMGDWATVEVFGSDEAAEHASVKVVRQGAVWRIEPELPDPVTTSRREGL